MRPPEVLKELKELREAWRKQGFSYAKEQQTRYEELRRLRHERVKFMYDNGLVFKGANKKEVS